MIKQTLKWALGERLIGIIDYYRYSHLRASWGGAFNGQQHRQQMVATFIRQLPLDAIVETGTYRGTTTAYLAKLTPLPIYTVEFSRRFQGFSWLALRRFKNIHRACGDSRPFSRSLAANKHLCGKVILFYLDAHWNSDLPLQKNWRSYLLIGGSGGILIDDFR